ncbi:MAG: hypothetical protein L0H70_04870 [Xanthomonadales bacterium]|nr:hypothetical protein [Xanthomonadales bacterium]
MSVPTLPLSLEGMRFKGGRDYLHGTDILPIALNALSSGRPLNVISEMDIVFHSLARTGLTLYGDAPSGRKAKAQLSCTIDGARCKLTLAEDGRPITDRHPYAEEQIVAATMIDVASATATSTGTLPFTNIERWIAMIKALHHAAYPQAEGKWLFARAKLASYQDLQVEPVEHRVSIQSNFGCKLTRSELTVDGCNLGDIFFVLA